MKRLESETALGTKQVYRLLLHLTIGLHPVRPSINVQRGQVVVVLDFVLRMTCTVRTKGGDNAQLFEYVPMRKARSFARVMRVDGF